MEKFAKKKNQKKLINIKKSVYRHGKNF